MIPNTSSDNSIPEKKSSAKFLWIAILIVAVVLIILFFFKNQLWQPATTPPAVVEKDSLPTANAPMVEDTVGVFSKFIVPHDVRIKDYFTFIDSVSRSFDSILPYKLTEYILVRNNPFIIDTLENTDYYRRKLRDTVIYDQKELVILKRGDVLKIPTLAVADTIKAKLARTRLDINIPEFKLRIIEGGDTVYSFPIRVGQNRTRFLSEVGREVSLKTRTGSGFIVHSYKKDYFVDPLEGKKFTSTKRDDSTMTLMPLQPWLEPKMEGQFWGQLIHPTTNETSLGKPFSNGCMGTREADIWRIYYYAPVGTKVKVRYDLTIKNDSGEMVRLKDIYNPKNMKYDKKIE